MTPTIRKVLDSNRITDVSALAISELAVLVAIGLDSDDAKRLIEEADIVMKKNGIGFVMGDALLQEYEEREILTTGCQSLDRILGGGLETQRVYEFYGSNGVGKTNLLHQLICTAMLKKENGGLDCPIIYLDAEGNFSPKRIRMIAPRFSLKPSFVLSRIAKYSIPTSKILQKSVTKDIYPILNETGARLILLDSITTNVRAEYEGETSLPIRQNVLGKIVHALKDIAQTYNAVVVVINQVTSNPKNNTTTFSGGNILGHEIQVRVAIRRLTGLGDQRDFYVEKAVDLENNSCLLTMHSQGFYEVGEDPSPEEKLKREV